jgi:hypothetical protein
MNFHLPLLFFAFSLACSASDAAPPSQGGRADGDEARERASSNCFTCHSQFSVAGTVRTDGPSGTRKIELVDSDGVRAIMYPNPYGNFFRHVRLAPPFEVRVTLNNGTVREMRNAPHGSCNACHHDLENSAGKL